MTSPIIATDAHPNQGFANITQLGLKALDLAKLHQAAIEPRLPANTLVGLGADLDALGVVVPGAILVRQASQTATAEQNAALEKGHARVRAVRSAVRKAGAPKEVQKAYGVGVRVNPAVVRDVKAALGQIIDRAAANPAEVAGFGIVKKDLDALSALYQEIGDVDRTQEQKRASAPQSTKARNRTANRILKAVALISAAGMLEFVDAPELFAGFEALKAPARSKSRSAKARAASD